MFQFVFVFVCLFRVCLAYHGPLTWYRTGLTACGFVAQDGDPIVAVGQMQQRFKCGDKVRLQYGNIVTYAFIVDDCQACAIDHIDVSPGVHMTLTGGLTGVDAVQWDVTDANLQLVSSGACGQNIVCAGADRYCAGVCVTLPPRNLEDILVGLPGRDYQQCSGAGFPVPLVCESPGFSCVSMEAWGRSDMGQCLPSSIVIEPRPSYLDYTIEVVQVSSAFIPSPEGERALSDFATGTTIDVFSSHLYTPTRTMQVSVAYVTSATSVVAHSTSVVFTRTTSGYVSKQLELIVTTSSELTKVSSVSSHTIARQTTSSIPSAVQRCATRLT